MSERHQPLTPAWWLVAAAIALVGVLILSLMTGAVAIKASDLWAWATGQLGDDDLAGRVLSGVRLPRTLAALVVGSILGVAGTALQGIHRTSIIDAHLIGISAAAGMGVAIGYAVPVQGESLPLAIAGGIALGCGYAVLSRILGNPHSGSLGLVLTGIAAGLAITAWTGLFVLISNSTAVPTLSFFIFGSLAGVTWTVVVVGGIVALIGISSLWIAGPGLDVLSLGEQAATHLGFGANTRVPIVLAVIGATVGMAVAIGGVIGFVGLLVPLIVRPMVGSQHRLSIPASALVGAIVVILIDVLARTAAAPIEIPIGLLTGAIGGPALVWLAHREVIR